MKSTITIIILCAAAICAPAETKKKGKTAPARPVVTIPKDAVQSPDGTYSYTDKDGKKWTYAKNALWSRENRVRGYAWLNGSGTGGFRFDKGCRQGRHGKV